MGKRREAMSEGKKSYQNWKRRIFNTILLKSICLL